MHRLAQQRGQGVGLPSGEAVARHLGIAPLTTDDVGIASTGWRGDTPLWYYILREADVCAGGSTLGPEGGCVGGYNTDAGSSSGSASHSARLIQQSENKDAHHSPCWSGGSFFV